MAERESRKRKATEEGAQYRQGLAAAAAQSEERKKSRMIGKEVNTDLADLFGKMKAADAPVAEMDVGRGRRRKTRKSKKSKKKSRKTRKH